MKKGEIIEDVYYTMEKIQLSDGRYRFKYVDEMGKERCVYSWRLDHNDATPKGKRRTLSLREMEKKIQADHFEQIARNGGNMTVLELVEKYTSTKNRCQTYYSCRIRNSYQSFFFQMDLSSIN